MGLSIHYNGSFRKDASLIEMIEEVKDIASIYNWPYHIFETEFPAGDAETDGVKKIYGIYITPPECETIALSFLANRRMSSDDNLLFYGNATNAEEQSYLYMLSVKTQFAGVEIHKLVIHLLKYLDKKYFQEFNLSDEGKYWETGDELLLEETFRRYTDLIDATAFAIENFPMQTGETFEAYFQRVLNYKNRKA